MNKPRITAFCMIILMMTAMTWAAPVTDNGPTSKTHINLTASRPDQDYSDNIVFSDDFSNGLSNWTLYGSPSSKIVTVHGETAFDNNGDSWCSNRK